MALIPAAPRQRATTAIPSSAFSKGDLLMFDSNSSLSRVPETFPAAALICGVAMASSLQSLNNQVPYSIARPGDVYFSDATTGSQFTAGERLDFEYTGATFRVSTSANTPIAIIDARGGSADIVGSDVSRVLVTLDHSQLLYDS